VRRWLSRSSLFVFGEDEVGFAGEDFQVAGYVGYG
jgi:hypothetical protein